MKSIDWTEIQTVITVAKEGSLSAASRVLGVNHSTVLRRIQNFEQEHHVPIFQREKKGYQLTHHGRALLQDFEKLDLEMLGLQRRITEYDTELQGRMTVTTTDSLFNHFLSQPLFEFAKTYPSIDLDLLISNQVVDMDHLEADIAVRPAGNVPDEFDGFRLFSLQFYFYVPLALMDQLDANQLSDTEYWIGYSGSLASSRAGETLSERMTKPPLLTANNFEGVARAADSGLGIALLPSFMGDAKNNLRRLETNFVFETDVFVVAPKDLSVSRKIQALLNFLNDKFNPS